MENEFTRQLQNIGFRGKAKTSASECFGEKKKRQIMFISHQKQMAVTRVVLAVFRAVVDLPGL